MRQELIYAPGGSLPAIEDVIRGMGNHNERRRLKRAEIAKRRSMKLGPVVTEELIPPGSLLSDETLECIRRGEYRIALVTEPQGRKRRAHRRYAR